MRVHNLTPFPSPPKRRGVHRFERGGVRSAQNKAKNDRFELDAVNGFVNHSPPSPPKRGGGREVGSSRRSDISTQPP